jgi:hypothetical protein
MIRMSLKKAFQNLEQNGVRILTSSTRWALYDLWMGFKDSDANMLNLMSGDPYDYL